MESVLQRKDGTLFPVSVDSNLLEANGRQFACTFLQDITQRKEAEPAQQQNELRFRSIYNQLQLQIERMPLAYILLDADLRVSIGIRPPKKPSAIGSTKCWAWCRRSRRSSRRTAAPRSKNCSAACAWETCRPTG